MNDAQCSFSVALCRVGMNLLIAIFLLIILFPKLIRAQALPENEMRTHFINVGQGNATLLEFSCGAVLLDAGAEGPYTQAGLTRYLKRFFERRTDLNSTLNLVVVTHAHTDHNAGLRDVLTGFRVLNYVDNGLRYGSGRVNQKWAQDNAKSKGIGYANYSYDQVVAAGGQKGITGPILVLPGCQDGPKISVLSGRFEKVPIGMTREELDANGNLHSLVVKVVFGKSSFLFTGDLEEKAMHRVVELYKGSGTLDCDVWEVSHHGSYNGTTMEWLDAVSPKYAVIPCGKWDSGKIGAKDNFNTYSFGHPRIAALDMLQRKIGDKRSVLDSVVAFYGQRENHRKYKVTQNIYCNAWDGTVVIKAFKSGEYSMVTPTESLEAVSR